MRRYSYLALSFQRHDRSPPNLLVVYQAHSVATKHQIVPFQSKKILRKLKFLLDQVLNSSVRFSQNTGVLDKEACKELRIVLVFLLGLVLATASPIRIQKEVVKGGCEIPKLDRN